MSNNFDDDMNIYYEEIHKTEIVTILLAVLSGIASLSVVFILTYKYKELVDKRDFIHYVYMIAIADTSTSFMYSLGYPKPGPICSIQSFITSFSAVNINISKYDNNNNNNNNIIILEKFLVLD